MDSDAFAAILALVFLLLGVGALALSNGANELGWRIASKFLFALSGASGVAAGVLALT